MTYFKDNLLYLRKKNNFSQLFLAEKLGIGRTTITNYEKGLSEPDYEMLSKIATMLDITVDDLLKRELNDGNVEQLKQGQPIAVPGIGIPLIPIDAFAGISNQTDYSIEFKTISERYIVPLFKNIDPDFLISVRGTSMWPKYNNGDIVACKFVKDKSFIQWNNIYVIDTISQGVMMKRIIKSSIKDHFTFRSDNSEYQDFDVPIKDIRNIALVLGGICLE